MDWDVEGRGEPNGRGHATVRNPPSAREIKMSWSTTTTPHPTHGFFLSHWMVSYIFTEAIQTLHIVQYISIHASLIKF